MKRSKLIPVLPKNYRSIALYAASIAADPVILVNRKTTTDLSEQGPLTQKNIRSFINFEIRDGVTPILGFHDHPDEMWVAEAYVHVAQHCESEGWLTVQGVAS